MSGHKVEIHIGGITKLQDGTESGIFKSRVLGPIELKADGLVGDKQADLKHHGGLEKALHHYAFDHYKTWRSEYPQLEKSLKVPGAFGENISTIGLTEKDICVGDTFSLGSAAIQVSQGRQPCWKLGVRFGMKRMPLLVQRTGRLGWYYRVIETGEVETGKSLKLVDRPHPQWPISRLIDLLYVNTKDFDALESMAELELLTESWRETARKRLKKREVESWTSRLTNSLEASYSEAIYRVACPSPFDLKVGIAHAEFAAWLDAQRVDSWAIVTACNPYSEPLSDAENAQRMKHLGESLRREFPGESIFQALGLAADGSWDEVSVLVVGISEERAKMLGKEFEQNAVVYGESDAIARLIWCF